MRLSKIYTRQGDKSKTSLSSLDKSDPKNPQIIKVDKHHIRIEVCGQLDELNCLVGLFYAECVHHKFDHELVQKLDYIQNRLFDIGGELSFDDVDPITNYTDKVLSSSHTKDLEKDIDLYSKDLANLKNFILPRGHLLTCRAHMCRAVCRRAEVSLSKLASEHNVSSAILSYINRLSDWFFVVSRVITACYKETEVLWQQDKKSMT